MTMTCADERRLNLKTHCTTKAAPTNFLAHLPRHCSDVCTAKTIATV
jgi:hypothetical protein